MDELTTVVRSIEGAIPHLRVAMPKRCYSSVHGTNDCSTCWAWAYFDGLEADLKKLKDALAIVDALKT